MTINDIIHNNIYSNNNYNNNNNNANNNANNYKNNNANNYKNNNANNNANNYKNNNANNYNNSNDNNDHNYNNNYISNETSFLNPLQPSQSLNFFENLYSNESLHVHSNESLHDYSNESLHDYSNGSLNLYHNESLPLYNFTLQEVVNHYAYPAVLIDRSITPLWYFIGIIGNSLSIAVWLQKRLRRNSSSAVYFAALSISDIVMLLLHMLQELNNTWYINTLGYPVLCETYAVFYLAGQYLAPIFVFCFTIDRYIAICFPFKKSKYCTPRQALKVVLLVVLLCFLLCSVQGYFWHYDSIRQVCTLRDYFISNTTGTFWFHWTTSTESLIFFVIPVLNLIANIRVIKEIYKISKTQQPAPIITRPRASSHQHQSNDPAKQQVVSSLRSKQLNNPQLLQQHCSLLSKQGANSRSSLFVASNRSTCLSPTSARNSYSFVAPKTTSQQHHPSGTSVATNVMLLSVSFYVIFTTLPPAIIYAVETMYPEGSLTNTNHLLIASDPTWKRYITFIHVKAVVYELCISHYACNFFIFILTGRKFRNAAVSTLSCRKMASENDNCYYGNSNNVNNNNNNLNSCSNHLADSHIDCGDTSKNRRKVSELKILFHDSLRYP